MDFISNFKSLPVSTKRLLGIGAVLALVIALPLFVYSIMFGKFLFGQRAASGEPGICNPVNKIISVTPITDTAGTCHDIQTAVDAVTGDGFTIQVAAGTYNVTSTINILGKSNLTITGNTSNNSLTQIAFNSNGWGFNVSSSSGEIQWLTAQGVTPNGLLSINNGSSNFHIGYANLNATSSHTLDIQGSNNISISNTDIQSSAGAIEIGNSSNITIANNKIHNSSNAISVNGSSYVTIASNLVYANRESGLVLTNNSPTQILRNTFVNNGSGANTPTISLGNPSGQNNQFNLNIVTGNNAPGILGTGGQTFSMFSQNDVYGNNPNYSNYPNQTGVSSNISLDPMLNNLNNVFCPAPNSPVVFGSVANGDYMGYIAPCGGYPTPSPTPIITPTPTPTPSCVPMPACINAIPACKLPTPEGGWCPATPSPSPVQSIQVTSPNGGENLAVGQHFTITWTGTGVNGYLIYLVNSLGQESLINGTTAPTTSYDWTVSSPLSGSTYYKIKVIDSAFGGTSGVSDMSDNYFTISGQSTPPPTVRPFSILLKLNGVDGGSADGAKATVHFESSVLPNLGYITPALPISYVGNGVYKLMFGVWSTNLPAGNDYAIVVKGEKHLGTKFCQVNGQTKHCSGPGQITIPGDPSTAVNLDFTGIPLMPGDVYPQDGMADSNDFNAIVGLLSKPCSALTDQDKLIGDLDYSGCINVRDMFLMRQTLQTRYDDN